MRNSLHWEWICPVSGKPPPPPPPPNISKKKSHRMENYEALIEFQWKHNHLDVKNSSDCLLSSCMSQSSYNDRICLYCLTSKR